MQTGWLTHAGPYKIEHVPCPHPGLLDNAAYKHRKGVQHTTEGATIEGALSRFLHEMVGSTFIVGRDSKKKARILQLVTLGYAAAALQHTRAPQTNGLAIAQIELVGFSQTRPWDPDAVVLDMLAALYWQLEQSCGIPLKHISNPTRSSSVWVAAEGWLGHVDVPENDHVDPRALRYGDVFERARRFDLKSVHPKPKAKIKPRPRPKAVAPGTAIMLLRAHRTAPAAACAGGRQAKAA